MACEFVWVLHGNTFEHREELKRAGWMWHPSEKVWTKRYDAMALGENHQLRTWLKSLRGVSVSQERAIKFGYG